MNGLTKILGIESYNMNKDNVNKRNWSGVKNPPVLGNHGIIKLHKQDEGSICPIDLAGSQKPVIIKCPVHPSSCLCIPCNVF